MVTRELKSGTLMVDDCDAPLVAGRITVTTTRSNRQVDVFIGGQKRRLPRVILSCKAGLVVDHINGNPMDNRRANLRICTLRENSWNRVSRRDGASPFKGVCVAKGGKWSAQIKADDVRRHLGTFATEAEAARAYDAVAREAFGAFATLNFPNEGEQSAMRPRARGDVPIVREPAALFVSPIHEAGVTRGH